MLSTREIQAKAEKHLDCHFWDACPDDAWPFSISLKVPSGRNLTIGEDLARWSQDIREYAARHHLELEEEGRDFGFRGIRVPVKVTIPDERTAGRLTLEDDDLDWRDERVDQLVRYGLDRADAVSCAKLSREYSDVDFDLLLTAGRWFQDNDADGMTPRQVPIPGFHAKWLDGRGRRKLVALLAGKEELGLRERPTEVRMKRLDSREPGFGLILAGTGEDSDEAKPAYPVTLAIIVENKDTFLDFPSISGAVCLLGAGDAAVKTIAAISWLHDVDEIVYWGDVDFDGFETLALLRQSGVACGSILMNRETYDRYSQYGTDSMRTGRAVAVDREAAPIDGLSESEQELYLQLKRGILHPSRIEQERILYEDALTEIAKTTNHSGV